MGKISPWVFIGLGIFVTLTSSFNDKLHFFLIFGISFIIWGLVGFITRKSSSKSVKSVHSHSSASFHHQNSPSSPSLNRSHPANLNRGAHQQHPSQYNQQHPYKRCPNCHKLILREYRFCPYCGYGV